MAVLSDAFRVTSGSRYIAVVICIFTSLGGIFFGYDQGVTSGVLVMDSFLRDFCVGIAPTITMTMCQSTSTSLPNAWLAFSTYYNMTYNCGCMLGALLGGVVADKLGRRASVFAGACWFCIGTTSICVMPAQQHVTLLVARVLQGMGVGNASFSLPIYGAEVAPKELRGLLSGFMQMMIVTGILLATTVNVLVKEGAQGWRVTNAVSLVTPLLVMLGIWCVPESPRWVYMHKGVGAAAGVLQRVRRTHDIENELYAISAQIVADGGRDAKWGELLHPRVARRVRIAAALQFLVQATGINPMFTYGGLIFRDIAGGDGTLSVLLLAVVNFLSTIPAMRWVDTVGRRKLLLLGSVGCVVGHLVSAVTFTLGCRGNTTVSDCATAPGYLIVVSSAFFVFHFAISWGPIGWIYPAEIFPLGVRAKAVAISTTANWLGGVVMMNVATLFPHLNINGVFLVFAVLCACAGVFVFYYCPETTGVLLEDVDELFCSTSSKRSWQGLQTEGGRGPAVWALASQIS